MYLFMHLQLNCGCMHVCLYKIKYVRVLMKSIALTKLVGVCRAYFQFESSQYHKETIIEFVPQSITGLLLTDEK